MVGFMSPETTEAILNELTPIDKHLPKAYLENGALNEIDENFMLVKWPVHPLGSSSTR